MKDRRLTQNRAILAFSRSRKTQNIPKRVTNGEPNDLGWELKAPAVNESPLSVEGGGFVYPQESKGFAKLGDPALFSVSKRVTNGVHS
jgi:hypothetical protein